MDKKKFSGLLRIKSTKSRGYLQPYPYQSKFRVQSSTQLDKKNDQQVFLFVKTSIPSYVLIYNISQKKYLYSKSTYDTYLINVKKENVGNGPNDVKKDGLLWKVDMKVATTLFGGAKSNETFYIINRLTNGCLSVRGAESFTGMGSIDRICWTRSHLNSPALKAVWEEFTFESVKGGEKEVEHVKKKPQLSFLENLKTDMLNLYKNSELSDIKIKVGRKYSFKGHKIILITRSVFFKELIEGKYKKKKEIDLSSVTSFDNIDANNFDVIFKYLYTGELDITGKNVLDIHGISSKLDMGDVQKICSSFINEMFDSKSVVELLLQAHLRKNKKIIDTCMKTIEENTEEILDSLELCDLSEPTLLKIVKSNYLSCSEKSLFDAIINWWCANKDVILPKGNKKQQDKFLVDKYLFFVRFSLMNSEELAEIEKMKLVDEKIFMDAYRHMACTKFENTSLFGKTTAPSSRIKGDIYKSTKFREMPRTSRVFLDHKLLQF